MYDSKTVGEAYSSLLISKEKMIKAIHQEAIANFLMNVPGLSSITWDFSYYKGSSDMPYQKLSTYRPEAKAPALQAGYPRFES